MDWEIPCTKRGIVKKGFVVSYFCTRVSEGRLTYSEICEKYPKPAPPEGYIPEVEQAPNPGPSTPQDRAPDVQRQRSTEGGTKTMAQRQESHESNKGERKPT